ncbi:MAG: hypothetical protein FD189_2423 [Elusimicrobia bacterium]|nr:MAG: hypothetical protein FD154_983 [Elusimicrobiota bacterium]KAF0152989.1 MAG: hypothetical protein FD189_2423 [Elusimicrobiota bacterium]
MNFRQLSGVLDIYGSENFYDGAGLAREFEYWNAAGLLAAHAAIAFTDAATIRFGGFKSSGEDHMAAVDLLRETVSRDERGNEAVRHLARIIEEKNLVSYSGDVYTRADTEKLWKHLERYRAWALELLG